VEEKLLGRANPERRQAFVEQIQDLLAGARHDRHLLARLRGLGHFRGFGPLKINELIKKVFTTAGAGARATEWNLGRDLDIADQRELAEGACERQSDTFRISWQ